MSRVESPSSINTYKQCPRKYYYRYIEALPSFPSIHLIRGKIVHTVLENFFDIDAKISSEDALRLHLFWLFEKIWNDNYEELSELKLGDSKLKFYYGESKEMLQNWFKRFQKKFRNQLDDGKTFTQAFEHLTPTREKEFVSKKHNVRGFIDVLFENNTKIVILDYKTSKNAHMTPEYRLQLGIYAMMYEEANDVRPDLVGVDFLKHNEFLIPVDDALVNEARTEVDKIHTKTISKDQNDYPQQTSPLCKWSTGQCDYFKQCFEE